MKILAFGEVLWDFINGDKHFGGAPVNFAAHVIKCGGESGIVTAVGRDSLGEQAILKIKELGISDDFVQQVDRRITGRVMVFLDKGQPTYRITREVAYDYIDKGAIQLSKVNPYDAFYFGTLIQRNTESREALYHILDSCHFTTVFLDLNLRRDCYSKEVIEKSLQYCTILKMNEEEAMVIGRLIYNSDFSLQDLVNQVRKDHSQIKIVLMTRGDKGCFVFLEDRYVSVPSKPIVVKDTVGAGDAFCAGFLTTYIRTADARKAARIGNLVGGFVASVSGAVPIYPEKFARKIQILSEAEV